MLLFVCKSMWLKVKRFNFIVCDKELKFESDNCKRSLNYYYFSNFLELYSRKVVKCLSFFSSELTFNQLDNTYSF